MARAFRQSSMSLKPDENDDVLYELEEDKRLLSDWSVSPAALNRQLQRRDRLVKAQWAIIAVLLSIIVAWTTLPLKWQRCSNREQEFFAPSPALDSILKEGYHDDTINGSTHYRSSWQGYPSDELDAAWRSIVNEGLIGIPFEEAHTLGKPLHDRVVIPPDLTSKYGEGIVVSSDMAHELHCLNMIRMYTYEDYYRQKIPVPMLFQQSETKVLRAHIDHCIDVLRQNIMCTADTALITHRWIEGRPLMQPDFNVKKKCRSFDAMMDWISEREIKELNGRPGYGVPRGAEI